VLELTGIEYAARRRVGGFSLGMRQRLALASALIGDPETLVLDEPMNGLDPDGIVTMRHFLRQFADNGGTVLVSSHLLAEIAHSADDAIIIDRGRLVSAGPIADLVSRTATIAVTTTDADALSRALALRGARVERIGPDQLSVADLDRAAVGRAALDIGAVILEMRSHGDDLEDIFQSLIHPQEYAS
jgi:ABC-2 type transport system ATP-binding protein